MENLDWHRCIERYDREHAFFYLAPPYWQTEGYGVPFPFHEYEAMAEIMQRVRGRVMVSINDHPDIRRAFVGHHMLELDIKYSNGNQRQGAPTASGELVITNWNAEESGGAVRIKRYGANDNTVFHCRGSKIITIGKDFL